MGLVMSFQILGDERPRNTNTSRDGADAQKCEI